MRGVTGGCDGGGVGAASPGSPAAWHCGRGQRVPRAPLPRRFPPAELIPCSSGLTNFTALAPTALSRHPFNLQPFPSHHHHHHHPSTLTHTPSLPSWNVDFPFSHLRLRVPGCPVLSLPLHIHNWRVYFMPPLMSFQTILPHSNLRKY